MKFLGEYVYWVMVFVVVLILVGWVGSWFIEPHDPIPRLPY